MSAKKVLISGAGIGGPTLAFWLNAAGLEVTLIERARTLRTGGYVIDFWGLGYDIAERMGLGSDIDRIGYHMRELQIVGDHATASRALDPGVSRANRGRFVTLGRSDLSRLLFEKIEGTTEVIFGDEIVGLQDDADRVLAQFERSAERWFDLVIGADGLHSGVRRLVFGPQQRFEKPLGYIVAAFEVRGYRPRDEEIYVIYSRPARMLARFALHDDRTLFLFVFTADAAALPIDEPPEQRAMLHEKFDNGNWECASILGELDCAQDLYFDRVSQIKMDSWSRGRVALVGDAAFCASLMAGQGSALAMTAAYVLAGELGKAEGSHAEAFYNYEMLLRSYIDSKQKGAERFSAAFAPKTQWGLFVRNQVIKACAIPGLARLAFGRDILDALQLPEYRWPACGPTTK